MRWPSSRVNVSVECAAARFSQTGQTSRLMATSSGIVGGAWGDGREPAAPGCQEPPVSSVSSQWKTHQLRCAIAAMRLRMPVSRVSFVPDLLPWDLMVPP